jgi:hypothetical protein
MGKSSIFAAWERAYFGSKDRPKLSAAVHHFGFILVTLRVRDYAGIASPNANRPEAWVFEIVRRRFEQFGLCTRDLDLIEAMLTAGQIALAFDGMNEADQDSALAAFAQQFPEVPLLITSQSSGDEGWETWKLPENLYTLREQLLALWMGTEKAAVLSKRIKAEGLANAIWSGYDLRLLADLASADPEASRLPNDRVELYRAILNQVSNNDKYSANVDKLKQLAWLMVTQRRRRNNVEG